MPHSHISNGRLGNPDVNLNIRPTTSKPVGKPIITSSDADVDLMMYTDEDSAIIENDDDGVLSEISSNEAE